MSQQQGEQDEEEDYMSEAFLNILVNADKDAKKQRADKQPLTYSQRRRQKELEHLANLPKPLRVREQEAREKGLETEIGEENKGMAMLLKMGFKKGGTLGAQKPSDKAISDQAGSFTSSAGSGAFSNRQNNNNHDDPRSDALRVPIAIQMKHGRGGLGMDTLRKRQAEEVIEKREEETRRVFDDDFRGQKRSQFDFEKRKRQLGAARGICMQLDAKREKAALSSSTLSSSPTSPSVKEGATTTDPDKDDEQATDAYQSQRRGRSNIFWWIDDSVPDDIIGTKAMGPGAEESMADVQPPVPAGQRSFDHSDDEDGDLESTKAKRIKLSTIEVDEILHGTTDVEVEMPKWGERPEFAKLEVHEKLEAVVRYLREEHWYCFWCSAQYYGQKDLVDNCPGESEEDH